MAPLIYRATLATALGACLVSFLWGMRNAFVFPRRKTSGLRLTVASGTVFGAFHFWVILTSVNLMTFLVCSALLLYLSALGLFWWTIIATGRRRLPACFTSIEPSALVTKGPYTLIRHPFYTSYLMVWGVGAIVTLSPLLLLTFIAMCTLYVSAARREEKALLIGIHSAEYLRYRNSTGMFFPWHWRRNAVNVQVGLPAGWDSRNK
jgi:protein-S-isoprenylcysteine O-methyltransferase Ste14